jgi:hypothetical protein
LSPYQGYFLSKNKVPKWGWALHFVEKWNCILLDFNVSVVEKPLKIESHFVAREVALRKATFCSKGSCPSEGNIL